MDWNSFMTLIGVIFSGGVSLIVCLLNQNTTRKLIEYRLGELEKKVDKQNNIAEQAQNNIIEKTHKLEERVTVLESGLAR